MLWLAAIQCVEGKQDLTGLAPKGRLIAAEPVQRVAGQIGQTQKATREVAGGFDGFERGAGRGSRLVCGFR